MCVCVSVCGRVPAQGPTTTRGGDDAGDAAVAWEVGVWVCVCVWGGGDGGFAAGGFVAGFDEGGGRLAFEVVEEVGFVELEEFVTVDPDDAFFADFLWVCLYMSVCVCVCE